jgi:hypothetical protein
MKQNYALLVAVAKGNGGGGGSGGGGGGNGNRRRDRGTKAICPSCNNLVVDCGIQLFHAPSKQGQDSNLLQAPQIGLTGTGVPR